MDVPLDEATLSDCPDPLAPHILNITPLPEASPMAWGL